MKQIIAFLVLAFLAINIFGQSPEKMSYQAVVRDNNNDFVANSIIGIQISILQKTTVVYVDNQTPMTNANGLISIEIGGKIGFDLIDWANGPYYIKTDIDPKGGKNYIISGTSQLMSVPYAFHAQTASYLTGGETLKLKSAEPGVNAQSWSKFGNTKTDPLVDKLGTTDLADMVFVTNNKERLRIRNDGSADLSGSLTVKNNVFLNTSAGGTTNSGTLTVGGITNLNNSLNINNGSPTHLTGDLDVDGSTSFVGETSFTGKTSMTGADFTGQVTINANLTGTVGQGSMAEYPLRVQGSDQGIAIKVNGSRGNAKNYVTFWDENGVQGRIEGETTKE